MARQGENLNTNLINMVIDNWHKHGRSYEVELRADMAIVTSFRNVVAAIHYDGHVELYSKRKVALKYVEMKEFAAGGSGVSYLYDDVELVIYVLRGIGIGGEPYLEFVLSSPDRERGTFRFSAGCIHETMDFDAAKNFDKMLISDVTKMFTT